MPYYPPPSGGGGPHASDHEDGGPDEIDVTGLVGSGGAHADGDHTGFILNTLGGKAIVQAHGNSGTTETIDITNGNFHTVTLDDDCAFTFSGATNGVECSFALRLTQDGTGSRTVTWPGSVTWPGGTPPTLLTAPGAVDHLAFTTTDGGTTWYGFYDQAGGGSITIEEEDGSPSVTMTTLKVPNNSLTDLGSGVVSLRDIPTGFIGARAYRTTNQSLSDNTNTAITLDAERFDTDSFHSTSSNTSRMTIPAGLGGKYLISGQASFAGNATGTRIVWLALNGDATRIAMEQHPGTTAGPWITVSTVYDLVPGDYVEMYANQTSGGSLNVLTGANYSPELLVVKLDAGNVGSAVGAKAYNSTTQSIPNNAETAVTFDSEEWDTDGFHSTSSNTSRLTVPAGMGGKYRITTTVVWANATSGQRVVYWKKNGSTYLRGGMLQDGTPASALTHSTLLTLDVDLVAGDYVEVSVFQNSGGSLNIGHASAEYVQSQASIMRIDALPAGNVPSVTAMPTGPTTGQRVYRSDHKMEFVYDGTRWLCTCSHIMEIRPDTVMPFTASTGGRALNPGHAYDLNIWMEKYWADTVVLTTNSGSQYWDILLDNPAGGAAIGTLSTISNSPNIGTTESVTMNSVYANSDLWFTVSINKVSTPGNLFASIGLSYRFIGV